MNPAVSFYCSVGQLLLGDARTPITLLGHPAKLRQQFSRVFVSRRESQLSGVLRLLVFPVCN